MDAVLGFMAPDGSALPSKLSLPESDNMTVINVGFIKGAFSGFYYYRMNVIPTEGTASTSSSRTNILFKPEYSRNFSEGRKGPFKCIG